MSVTVRALNCDDQHLLSNIATDVFDHPINEQWAGEFFRDPRHHLVVALDAGVVVGMVSGVHYVHPDKRPELWINEVGVALSFRGQGIASRLLEVLLDVGRRCGCEQAWVLTEQSNVPAMRLYAGLNGTARDRVMFTFDLCGNRPAG